MLTWGEAKIKTDPHCYYLWVIVCLFWTNTTVPLSTVSPNESNWQKGVPQIPDHFFFSTCDIKECLKKSNYFFPFYSFLRWPWPVCKLNHAKNYMDEDVPLVKLMYIVFTPMPGENYHRQFRTSLFSCESKILTCISCLVYHCSLVIVNLAVFAFLTDTLENMLRPFTWNIHKVRSPK